MVSENKGNPSVDLFFFVLQDVISVNFTLLNDKMFVPSRDFTISKKVFDGQCAEQKNQVLLI